MLAMTVARQTTKIGPGGELRIAREIRDAARVTDGQQVTIEVSPDDAIVIRHAVSSDGDLVEVLARAKRLRARVQATGSAASVVREGRDELERRHPRA